MERHHLLWPKKLHEIQAPNRELRQLNTSMGYLDHDSHTALHQAISGVPVFSYQIALGALKHLDTLNYTENPIERLEQLQTSLEVSMLQPRADRIERELSELAIYALELQKPFFDKSLPTRLDIHRYRRRNDILVRGGSHERAI